ncbi:Hint domain-containing protein [Jannaschia rubra]|uniref:Hedgehog/Intein (Hint) domain-containing protein n=1 Tax=Jannaschia rubra TaxID=282197 RepID=A0A0M6XRZ2_9RHOB|nr:Hint domain-containing protein [Jannaschia rubra]CTQ32925.1 hypothetical protein JAN5088_01699 [Jannaschia rubra]SFG27431.1 Hint domain-containing protein [Jannaschia rubra]
MTDNPIFSRPGFAAGAGASDPPPMFLPGTLLATPDGPRAVETLAEGDILTTLSGPQAVTAVGVEVVPRADWAFRREIWPVRVPVGSLGNPRPMRLAPGQRVVLSGSTVERVCGVAQVRVALRDLVGIRGLITERPLADLRRHGLSLGTPAVIEAEGILCATGDDRAEDVALDIIRTAFAEMHAAGEPPLRL